MTKMYNNGMVQFEMDMREEERALAEEEHRRYKEQRDFTERQVAAEEAKAIAFASIANAINNLAASIRDTRK